MKIFTSNQIAAIDAYTIKNEPVRSIELMERASKTLFRVFRKYYSDKVPVKIFVGPGNNGGDALALARMLDECGYAIEVFLLATKLSTDAEENLKRLQKLENVHILPVNSTGDLPTLNAGDVIVDGIFGSGLSREAEGLYAETIQWMNKTNAEIFSIDIPSGLFAEENRIQGKIGVHATHTVAFQFPKLAFFFAENDAYIGKWQFTNIGLHPQVQEDTPSPYYYITKKDIRELLRGRKKFSHKGTYGHGLLLAGSYGKMGAGVLAARAALKSGLGLLTVQVPHTGYGILQTAVPEAMVNIDRSDYLISEFPSPNEFEAIAVGPGLGTKSNTREMLYNLLLETTRPMVIDADALNILADEKEWLHHIPENSILTPHPKEFERLTHTVKTACERHVLQMEFAKKYQVIVVLKGAYTSVATPDGICCFNSTGNPGMATAGSGDVLTGMLLSLLCQQYSPTEAAVLGVWLHGKAGDLYTRKNAVESLTASDIIAKTGKAFRAIRKS